MASKPRVVHLSSRSAKIFLHHSNTAPFGAVFLFLRRAANVSAEMEENGTSHSRGRDFLTHGLYPGGVTAPPAALRSSANANFCKNVGEWRQPFSGRDRRVFGFAANGVTTREDTSVSYKSRTHSGAAFSMCGRPVVFAELEENGVNRSQGQ